MYMFGSLEFGMSFKNHQYISPTMLQITKLS